VYIYPHTPNNLSFIYYTRKEQSNILHEISKRKANWIGHILRRNCLLQHVIEGKIKGGIEVTGRRERWRRKLLDDLKERREYSYLKDEALDRTMWRARFGRGFGPDLSQTANWMTEYYTWSSFVSCTSRRAQSGMRTSLGRRVWFIESHIILAICLLWLLIYLFIYSWGKSPAVVQLNN
jgi:hypothetical protein